MVLVLKFLNLAPLTSSLHVRRSVVVYTIRYKMYMQYDQFVSLGQIIPIQTVRVPRG
jgi:hypothetical protein